MALGAALARPVVAWREDDYGILQLPGGTTFPVSFAAGRVPPCLSPAWGAAGLLFSWSGLVSVLPVLFRFSLLPNPAVTMQAQSWPWRLCGISLPFTCGIDPRDRHRAWLPSLRVSIKSTCCVKSQGEGTAETQWGGDSRVPRRLVPQSGARREVGRPCGLMEKEWWVWGAQGKDGPQDSCHSSPTRDEEPLRW